MACSQWEHSLMACSQWEHSLSMACSHWEHSLSMACSQWEHSHPCTRTPTSRPLPTPTLTQPIPLGPPPHLQLPLIKISPLPHPRVSALASRPVVRPRALTCLSSRTAGRGQHGFHWCLSAMASFLEDSDGRKLVIILKVKDQYIVFIKTTIDSLIVNKHQ